MLDAEPALELPPERPLSSNARSTAEPRHTTCRRAGDPLPGPRGGRSWTGRIRGCCRGSGARASRPAVASPSANPVGTRVGRRSQEVSHEAADPSRARPLPGRSASPSPARAPRRAAAQTDTSQSTTAAPPGPRIAVEHRKLDVRSGRHAGVIGTVVPGVVRAHRLAPGQARGRLEADRPRPHRCSGPLPPARATPTHRQRPRARPRRRRAGRRAGQARRRAPQRLPRRERVVVRPRPLRPAGRAAAARSRRASSASRTSRCRAARS